MKHTNSVAVWILSFSLVLSTGFPGKAEVVIGSWQNMTDEGWIDHGNGLSITAPENAGKYSFAQNVVPGYAVSLKITQAGWNQNLRLNLHNNPPLMEAFMSNQLLSFAFSVPAAAETGSTSGYSQIYAVYLNADGLGGRKSLGRLPRRPDGLTTMDRTECQTSIFGRGHRHVHKPW